MQSRWWSLIIYSSNTDSSRTRRNGPHDVIEPWVFQASPPNLVANVLTETNCISGSDHLHQTETLYRSSYKNRLMQLLPKHRATPDEPVYERLGHQVVRDRLSEPGHQIFSASQRRLRKARSPEQCSAWQLPSVAFVQRPGSLAKCRSKATFQRSERSD